MKLLLSYLIFPGFLFSACIGLFAGWVDRKVTARIQYRVGPPWYQNFMDIVKLLHKEIIIPEGARLTFLFAPFLGLLSVVLMSTILGRSLNIYASGFSGDLIVIVYLLVMPAIAMIIGASSSENPLASIGASREIKAVLAYELPFILSIIAIIVKSGGSIRIGSILNHQAFAGSNIASFSGAL
ncbi:MAG: NADH-quinone oxidoreductase subunit H, partial [Candidatus Omnitrophica bacterium]|nr:NADH-quinone oxidoreductase subunit H [Candidatus Omnitrophota bacterium]